MQIAQIIVLLSIGCQPLTKSEKSIPGVTELLPWFGEDWSEPLGDGPSVHGRLKGAEHEVQCINVIFSFLGNLFFQTAESALIQNGSYTCRDEKKSKCSENNNKNHIFAASTLSKCRWFAILYSAGSVCLMNSLTKEKISLWITTCKEKLFC